MSAVYTIFTSPDHPPVTDHLPTLIVTPHGKPQQILYTYLHTNYNRENYLLTPSPQGDLCVAKLFPPPTLGSQQPNGGRSASEGHGSSGSSGGQSARVVKCEASRNFRWSITNSGVLTPSYKCTLPSDDAPGGSGEEQPLFQISKTNPSSPFWTCWYYAYAGHLIPPKRIQFGHISKNIGPDGKPITGGGTRVTITGKTEDEKAVWKTLGEGNEDMVEWAVICAALHVLDDEIVKAAEKAGIRIGVMPGAMRGPANRQTPPAGSMPRPQLHPTGQQPGRAPPLQSPPIIPNSRAPMPMVNGHNAQMPQQQQLQQRGPPPQQPQQRPPPQQQAYSSHPQQQQQQQGSYFAQHQQPGPPQQPQPRGNSLPAPPAQMPQQRPPPSSHMNGQMPHPMQASSVPSRAGSLPSMPNGIPQSQSMPIPLPGPSNLRGPLQNGQYPQQSFPQQPKGRGPPPNQAAYPPRHNMSGPPDGQRTRLHSNNGAPRQPLPMSPDQRSPPVQMTQGPPQLNGYAQGRPGPGPANGPGQPQPNGYASSGLPPRPGPNDQQSYYPQRQNTAPPGADYRSPPNGSTNGIPPALRSAPLQADPQPPQHRSPLPQPGGSTYAPSPDMRTPGQSNFDPSARRPSAPNYGSRGDSLSSASAPRPSQTPPVHTQSQPAQSRPPVRAAQEDEAVDSVAFMLGATALNDATVGEGIDSMQDSTGGIGNTVNGSRSANSRVARILKTR